MFNSIVKSRFIERALSKLVLSFYDRQRRASWESGGEPPHFFSHRQGLVPFVFSDNPPSPFAYTRAFFSALAIRQGDTVLDIGCGDGFFTRRFLASRAGHVDGIDIEKDAVETARAFNNAANVAYYELDATKEPFPRDRYDAVIWDGALGHFSSSTTDTMFSKIANCLTEPGIFCGSESLGKEGGDHLQFFDTAEDLGRILLRHFPVVRVFSCEYPLGSGYERREAFWRCARSEEALRHLKWQSVTDS